MNSEKYLYISEHLLIRSLADKLGDSDVIFIDDNASSHGFCHGSENFLSKTNEGASMHSKDQH